AASGAHAGAGGAAQGARAAGRAVGAMNPSPDCPWTDDVIARHLDGDVATSHGEWRSAEELSEHLRDCAICQRHLQRSRRLDAVLAETTGRAGGGLDGEAARGSRLLAAAMAAVATPPPAAPPPLP